MTVLQRPDPTPRIDARDKATGTTRYSADLAAALAATDAGARLVHAVLVRSPLPRARLRAIDSTRARSSPGVVAIYTADDLPGGLCGRKVRDMPLLAHHEVRFSGERVAVVLADTARHAAQAADLVEVDYEALPALFDPVEALGEGAPALHRAPWRYPGAVVGPHQHPNLQSEVVLGSGDHVEQLLRASAHVVERRYRTPAQHQGYLEPQAWLAVPLGSRRVRLVGTTKAPYRLRQQLAACLDLAEDDLDVQPAPVGGDFGGKGAPGDAPVCVAAALAADRPVQLVLSSPEDITATDARHPSTVAVRVGCDAEGRLTALAVDALFSGGAYAAAKPIPSVNLHGVHDAALGYRFGAFWIRSRIAYTNTVPKGHMRAPGALQTVFAVESALDELAAGAGLDPAELRLRNVLGDGDTDSYGHRWEEARGALTLRTALGVEPVVDAPSGWRRGSGVALYARPTRAGATSLRLQRLDRQRLLLEVPIPETGTGSHSAMRSLLASRLALAPEQVEVRQAPTSQLGYDPGVGASRVTVGMALAIEELARRWEEHDDDGPVAVESDGSSWPAVLSFCAQLARVAVDPDTGQVRVLELVSAVDVARIVNPRAHQLQIDGGTVMGFGAAVLEDLGEEDGQVTAATLGDLKLPTSHDLPVLRTVLVDGGAGLGPTGVKSVGELTNVAVPAAVANAVADATGARISTLPITAERVYWALHPPDPQGQP